MHLLPKGRISSMNECIGWVPEHNELLQLYESLEDGVIFVKEDGTIKGMNSKACQVLGTGNDLPDKHLLDILPGSGLDLSKIPHVEGDEGEIPFERRVFELRLDHSSLGYIEASCRRLPGDSSGFLTIVRDVTKQWKDESAIKESEEKYRAAVEQSAENIYLMDVRTNRIIETNSALQELLGYSAEEMRGMEVSHFVAHPSNNISHQIQTVIEQGRAIIGERIYKKKDGGLVDVEVSASHLKYGERSVLCIVSRDITERNRARRQLIEERNRAELYLDLLAHDIGNLHHGMLSGLDMYSMVRGDGYKEGRAIDMVVGLLKRSVALVDNILKLTRLTTVPIIPESIPLMELLGRISSSVADSFPDKTPTIRFEGSGEGVKIIAEPIIEEAFYNIIHNAIKFQKGPEAMVEITVQRGTLGAIIIEISDQGPGIPPDVRGEIFNRFNSRPNQKQTGLGMSITKALVERSHGRVFIADRVQGDFRKGTRVVIELPVEP
jgi:PAS domain S-box-containing protein